MTEGNNRANSDAKHSEWTGNVQVLLQFGDIYCVEEVRLIRNVHKSLVEKSEGRDRTERCRRRLVDR